MGEVVELVNRHRPMVSGARTGNTPQIGANGGLDQRVVLELERMTTDRLGLIVDIGGGMTALRTVAGTDVNTRERANSSIDVLDGAIDMVSAYRARLGATQNRLEHTLNSLGIAQENLTAAESTIRDADMAQEMMAFTTNSILIQTSQAMLAQANQLPQGVLSLLRQLVLAAY